MKAIKITKIIEIIKITFLIIGLFSLVTPAQKISTGKNETTSQCEKNKKRCERKRDTREKWMV